MTGHFREISKWEDQDQNKQFRENRSIWKEGNFKSNPPIMSLERSMRNERALDHETRAGCNEKGTFRGD